MSRIKRISGEAIKGQTFEHALEPITIFSGPNGIGKTARLNAVALGLYGRLPDRKTNPAIFELASGQTMKVEVEFEDGHHITREWTKKGKTVKGAAGGATDLEFPPVMLDAGEYFSRSAAQQVEMIFGTFGQHVILDGKEATLEELVRHLIAIAGLGPQAGQATFLSGIPQNLNPIEFLSQAAENLTILRKGERARLDRMTKSLQGLSELRINAERINPVKHDIEKLQKHQLDLRERRGRLIETVDGQKNIQSFQTNERRKLSLERDKLRIEAPEEPEVDPDKLRDLLKAVPEGPHPDTVRKNLEELTHARAVLEANKAAAKATAQRLTILTVDQDPSATCPTCGASKRHWAAQDQLEKTIQEQEARVQDYDQQLQANEQETKEWSEWLEVERTRDQLAGQLRIATIQLKASELYRQARDATLEEIARIERDMESWPQVPNMAELERELYEIDCELEDIQQELQTLLQQDRQHEWELGEMKRLAEIEQEVEQGEKDLTRLSQTLVEIKILKANAINKAFGPLLEMANRFCRGIFEHEIEVRDNELGRYRDGVWCPVSTFSGSEQAIVYGAVSAAMTTNSSKILVIDELGRIDRDRRLAFLANIEQAIQAGLIDQLITADIDPVMSDHEGVITL